MNKYKILIVSDPESNKVIEDLYIAKSLRNDGHLVKITEIGCSEKDDNKYDVMLRRNTWEEDKVKDSYYKIRNDMLTRRVIYKKVQPVNVLGFQETRVQYLSRLFRMKKKVFPTVTRLQEMPAMLDVWDKDFALRDRTDFIAKNKPIIVNKSNIRDVFVPEKHAIQANMKYKSQLQFHFVGNKLMYTFEYTPSKYSAYSKAKLITPNEKERKIAEEFAEISNLNVGMQRLDFVRLLNDDLLLSEIKDTAVYMCLDKLDSDMRDKVIKEYKRNIYEFLEKDDETKFSIIYGRDLYDS